MTDERSLALRTHDGTRAIPVYSIRDRAHVEAIAQAMSERRMAAFYGGLYGVIKGIRRPADDHPDDAEVYWQIKPDRPRSSKLPMFIRPADAMPLVDFEALHPEFRHLSDRARFEALWASHGGPVHFIVPLRDQLPELHPAFQTSTEGILRAAKGEAGSRAPARVTASLMWMADAAWEGLAARLDALSDEPTYYGVSSFNDHGEHPPYTYAELVAFLDRKSDLPVDLIVNDEIFEASGAFSSHTQVRLPLVGEAAELILVRRGGMSPAWLTECTGYPVRSLEDAPQATRPEGLEDTDLQRRLELFRSLRAQRGF